MRVKGDHVFPPDTQERACLFWSEKMQGWMNRGLTLPPPSGPIPYMFAGLPDSTSNTMNVVKPQSPYVPVDARQPQLYNSPFESAPSKSMVGKPALMMEQTPQMPRSFFGKFSDLAGVPQTNAELTADETRGAKPCTNKTLVTDNATPGVWRTGGSSLSRLDL